MAHDAVRRVGKRARNAEKRDEAVGAANQLLEMVPDFASRGRSMISRYVKVDSLVDKVIEGLRKAGLAEFK